MIIKKLFKHKYFGVIALLIFILLIWFFYSTPFIFSDGYGYFHISKSLVNENSTFTTSAPQYLDYAGHTIGFFDGKFISMYQLGNSFFWYIPLKIASAISMPAVNYFSAFNGHTIIDGLLISIISLIVFVATLFVLKKILRNLNFGTKITVFSIAIVVIASIVAPYVFVFPAFSHIYEVILFSILILLFILFEKNRKNWLIFLAGLVSGLLVITRPVDIVLIAGVFFALIFSKHFKAFVYFIAGGLPMAIIFVLFNYSNLGCLLCSSQSLLTGANFDFTQFNLLKLLFSETRGLFVYSPALIFSFVGLIIFVKKDAKKFFVYLLPVLLTFGIYSFWPNWWAGDSIGQRFFLVLIPLWVVGMAQITASIHANKLKVIRKVLFPLIIILTIYSLLLQLLYRVTPTTKLSEIYPEIKTSYPEVTAVENFSPVMIFRFHFDEVSKGITNYAKSLPSYWNGGRSPLFLLLGLTDPIVLISNEKITFVGDNYERFNTDTFYLCIEVQNIENCYLVDEAKTGESVNIEKLKQLDKNQIPVNFEFSQIQNSGTKYTIYAEKRIRAKYNSTL